MYIHNISYNMIYIMYIYIYIICMSISKCIHYVHEYQLSPAEQADEKGSPCHSPPQNMVAMEVQQRHPTGRRMGAVQVVGHGG